MTVNAGDELDLISGAARGSRHESASDDEGLVLRRGMSLAQIERIVITETLQSCAGNKTRAAAILGISLKTLYNRLNEYSATTV